MSGPFLSCADNVGLRLIAALKRSAAFLIESTSARLPSNSLRHFGIHRGRLAGNVLSGRNEERGLSFLLLREI